MSPYAHPSEVGIALQQTCNKRTKATPRSTAATAAALAYDAAGQPRGGRSSSASDPSADRVCLSKDDVLDRLGAINSQVQQFQQMIEMMR
jgi:hypothetical protein